MNWKVRLGWFALGVVLCGIARGFAGDIPYWRWLACYLFSGFATHALDHVTSQERG